MRLQFFKHQDSGFKKIFNMDEQDKQDKGMSFILSILCIHVRKLYQK